MLNYNKNTLIALVLGSLALLFIVEYATIFWGHYLQNPNHQGIQCPEDSEFKSLPDIIHNNVPKNNLFLNITDGGLNIYIIILLGCVLFNLLKNTIPTLKYIILILLFLTCLLILRMITYSVTIVPPTAQGCREAQHKIVFNPLKLLNDDGNPKMDCIDYMFSGHVLLIITSALSLLFTKVSKNTFMDWRISKIILCIVTLITIFSVSASRLHYTSDVIISLTISCLSFYALYKNFLSKI
jgi:hypothetical protein